MFKKQAFTVLSLDMTEDGYGGFDEAITESHKGYGYIDLISGSDEHSTHLASVQESTHILITDWFDGYKQAITDDMLIDMNENRYEITYVDNVMDQNYHLEIYLKYRGDSDE